MHRALDTLGAAIGPLTAWAVLTLVPDGYRTIFWISAIPGSLAIAVVFLAVREKHPPRVEGARPALRLRHLGKPFALFTAVSFIFALGNSSDAMLILRAHRITSYNVCYTKLLRCPQGIVTQDDFAREDQPGDWRVKCR